MLQLLHKDFASFEQIFYGVSGQIRGEQISMVLLIDGALVRAAFGLIVGFQWPAQSRTRNRQAQGEGILLEISCVEQRLDCQNKL